MAEKKPFEDQIFNAFYSVFKSVGITPSIPQMESLREQSKRMSVSIDTHIQLQVISKVEKLQKAIIPAFRAMEKRIDNMEGAEAQPETPALIAPANELVSKDGRTKAPRKKSPRKKEEE